MTDAGKDAVHFSGNRVVDPRARHGTYDAGFAAGIEAAKQQVVFALEETADGDETVTPEMATLAEGIVERFCALTPSAPAPVVPKVKPLVWEHHPAGKMASNNMGGSYIIYARGPRPKWLKWPGGHGPDLETVEEMQAAAQADHEARTLSQIDMAPVTGPEAAIIVADAIDADVITANRIENEVYKTIANETPVRHWLSQILRALAEQEGE